VALCSRAVLCAIEKAGIAGMDLYRVAVYRASCIVSMFCQVVNAAQQLTRLEFRIWSSCQGGCSVSTAGCNGNEVELLK